MDLWHYLNGRCLMNHINLKEMEADDMLDVAHYLFEDDTVPTFDQYPESRSRIRESIWEDFYDTSYPYKFRAKDSQNADGNTASGYSEDPMTADPPPVKMTSKPYIPATDLDIASGVPKGLDGPLG